MSSALVLIGRLPWIRLFIGTCLFLTTIRTGIARTTTASLYVSNGSHILHLTPDGQVESVISQDIQRAVGLAVDMWRGLIFWTDIGAGHQGVYKASLDGSKVTRIIQDVGRLNGLSVDWVGRHVYWTDEERQTIEMSDYDGGNRKIVIDKDLKWPRGIIVDPLDGLIYWGDQGTQQIERARGDGTGRQSLVSTGLIWPNQLAISYHTRRLYWVDAFNKTIESCDLLGDSRREEHDILESPYSAPIFGLAIFDQWAYISTWYDGAIYSASLEQDAADRDVLRPEAEKLTERELFSIAVGEVQVQPIGGSPCGQLDRGGCSHICMMTSSILFRCACPTYGSLILGPDKKTCLEPSELLLYADKDKGHVGFLPLDGDNVTDHYILATSVMPVAIGYDPVDHLVYWSDVKERVIYRVGLKSLEKEIFLDETDGIGTVDGLYVDWPSRRLYFCNMGNSSPKSDGAVFSWHRIEFISLDRRQRRVVVTGPDKPRAIQIDSKRGYLYYSDWGQDPRVVRTNLDGSNPVNIRGPGDVSNPNGLALYGKWLYLVDSNYNGKVDAPYLAVYDTELDSWLILTDAQVTIPFGVGAKDKGIFFSDWVSTESDTGAVMVYDTTTRSTFLLSNRMSNPTGLHYSATNAELPESELCTGHNCSDICVPKPEVNSYVCLCPEAVGKVLQGDERTCSVPENFLLFTDLNTIKLVPLDTKTAARNAKNDVSDAHTYFVHYGHYSSNYVAVAYDQETDLMYWSDLNRKQILVRPLTGGNVHVFHEGEHAVDGMAFDRRARHLYWTGYNDYSGIVAMAKVGNSPGGATYSELVSGLDQPRAIVLDLENRYMYWTEYGVRSGRPRLSRAYLDGTNNQTLADTDLVWPNALAISGNLLYLADGSHRRIDVFNLDGTNRRELPLLTGDMDHIFGMAVFGEMLYYTDWLANITAVANIKSGKVRTLSVNLYRPGTVLLHHHTSEALALTDCQTGNHDCQELCIEIPGGYQCACLLGKKLAEDKTSCIDATTWQATDWYRCKEECHSNAHCARLMPTSVFRCVCRAGFYGDGVRECTACFQDTYKPSIGNGTCKLCPHGATTIGWTASATCTCDDANYDFISDECVIRPVDGNASNVSSRSTMPGYAISPPIFHNCPDGEILQYRLTENSSYAVLDIPLSATNWKGQEVPISGPYQVPPRVKLQWKGHGKKGYHHIIYRARDAWGLEAVCNFTVQVIDDQPPYFDYCPRDMELQTSTGQQRVFWREPKALDNVAISEIRKPLLRSGSAFEPGKWRQVYQATDGEGASVWCNFTITITQIDVLCDASSILGPQNGGIECRHVEGEGYRCLTFCDHIHHYINPAPEYHALYCQTKGEWREQFPEDYFTKACLRKTAARVVLQKLHFWLYGPCDPTSGATKSDIKNAILDILEEDGLCTWTYGKGAMHNACKEEIDVECWQGNQERRRNKRSGNVTDENVGGMTGDVLVQWTITAATKSKEAGTNQNLTEVEEKVTKRTSRLRARFDLGMTFDAAGATYRSKTEKAVVAPLALECARGSFNISNVCLLCPIGTFQWEEEGSCLDCVSGSYQDTEGQGSCKPCPPGTYSQRGSYNITQCVPVMIQAPALQAGKKAVIISVGAIVLALLTLILVFLCCRHYKRHRRFSGKMCDTGHTGQESPYVIEIRTNGHGHGSIAYEEIDGGEKAQNTPVKVNREHLEQSQQSAANDNTDVPIKGAIIRNNRAPPRGTTEKSQPLMGDNREEICLEVQSVLQAGTGSKGDENIIHVGYRDEDLEDTPVHSSTALLDHSHDDNQDD